MSRQARLLTSGALLVGVGLLLWLWFGQYGRSDGRSSLYVWQADAWLRGRTDLPYKLIDVALWKGRAYVPFPPFPSLLVLPFVALLGVAQTHTLVLGLSLTGVSALVLWQLGGRLGLEQARRLWLCAALLCGTGYSNVLLFSGTVWFFAHAVSFCCLLLALAESLGRQRGWLLGLLIGASFLSRQMTGFALLFPLVVLWPRRGALVGLLGGFGLCVGVYLWYNALRFGSPIATGYDLLELQGPLKAKAEQYGLFHPAFVPFNLAHLLIQGPHLVFGGPRQLEVLGADTYGTALPLASPFLLAAFLAKATAQVPRAYVCALTAATLLIVVPTLFYYNNGYQQVNCQRFTLDFLPLLVVPLALGLSRLPEPLWRALVLWSVLLNVLMLWR